MSACLTGSTRWSESAAIPCREANASAWDCSRDLPECPDPSAGRSYIGARFGTEQLVIQRLMAEHKGERTMIIVAHRMSTLKEADRILVFDQGRLVEQGRFEELAEDSASRFGSMYAMQST